MDYTDLLNAHTWANKGMSVKDIAKVLDCSLPTVYKLLNTNPADYWKEQEKRQKKMERVLRKARKILKGGLE